MSGESEFTPEELEQQDIDRLFNEQAKAQLEYREAVREGRLNRLPYSTENTRQAEPRIRRARDVRIQKARERLDKADAELRAKSDEIFKREGSE